MFEYEFDSFNDGTNDYSGNKFPFSHEYTVNLGTTLYEEASIGIDRLIGNIIKQSEVRDRRCRSDQAFRHCLSPAGSSENRIVHSRSRWPA
ncbi:hypothetical protein DO021_20700 [Desulfobacter hydrogenophilus]|uniref:Uncharacterized protein n=1 Tax=Desulfobacter hydrogenophilus TaxID=2291 RepID=A0A328FAM7_9BACT|nr:hypothetical protein [Desulfobacter hydrogenophilus]NDY74304.1 hypothetical protein [Desulfobacter hydrogenophilus]QBH15186.1 hypothetical protein EYB58_21040 [Desulfobacter hydrogenophilus]RAM00123.1 hypothetical protein DO021_20700 [Desulfobacter hydrogenophilus]